MPVDDEQAQLARSAWRRYGEGRHPAAPSFRGLFSYAPATASGEELLFKGEDFAQTGHHPRTQGTTSRPYTGDDVPTA